MWRVLFEKLSIIVQNVELLSQKSFLCVALPLCQGWQKWDMWTTLAVLHVGCYGDLQPWKPDTTNGMGEKPGFSDLLWFAPCLVVCCPQALSCPGQLFALLAPGLRPTTLFWAPCSLTPLLMGISLTTAQCPKLPTDGTSERAIVWVSANLWPPYWQSMS